MIGRFEGPPRSRPWATRADGGDIEAASSPGPPSTPLLELALAAAAGDANATGKLLRALAPRLVAIVRAILGASQPDLDDAVQQALIGLVPALPAFRGDCDPLGYARVIGVLRRERLSERRVVRAIRRLGARHAVWPASVRRHVQCDS